MTSKLLIEEERALNTIKGTRTISLPPHMLTLSGINETDKKARVALVDGKHGKFIAIIGIDQKK